MKFNSGRIATVLETIAEVQSRMLTIAEWNKDRLAGKDVESVNRQPEVALPEAPTAPAKAEPTYDELKLALIARGIEIPKGTKMTCGSFSLRNVSSRYKNL